MRVSVRVSMRVSHISSELTLWRPATDKQDFFQKHFIKDLTKTSETLDLTCKIIKFQVVCLILIFSFLEHTNQRSSSLLTKSCVSVAGRLRVISELMWFGIFCKITVKMSSSSILKSPWHGGSRASKRASKQVRR